MNGLPLNKLINKDGNPAWPEKRQELMSRGGGNPIENQEYNEALMELGTKRLTVDVDALARMFFDADMTDSDLQEYSQKDIAIAWKLRKREAEWLAANLQEFIRLEDGGEDER